MSQPSRLSAPGRCPECGSKQLRPWEDRCAHRRACEARQMLQSGAGATEAAHHAQRITTKDDAP